MTGVSDERLDSVRKRTRGLAWVDAPRDDDEIAGREAEHHAADTTREAGSGSPGTNRPGVGTSAAIERFLASPSLAEATRRSYRSDLSEFSSWLAAHGRSLDDVDARVLAAYAADLGADRPGRRPRKLARATVARKLAAVRSLLRETRGPALVPDLPLGGRGHRRLPHAPTVAETDALLRSLEGNDPSRFGTARSSSSPTRPGFARRRSST